MGPETKQNKTDSTTCSAGHDD